VSDPGSKGSSSILADGVSECWAEIDGARIRYLRAGSGPPLVLLHGLLGYSFSWRFTLPALSRHATVYAPDMLGAGFSDRPSGSDHSMRATALFLLRFLDQLGISTVDLLGTSRGGAVAMAMAAECLNPDSRVRIRRLVLVAPVNPYSAQGTWLASFFGSPLGAMLFRSTVARMPFLFPHWHQRMYGDRDNIPPGTFEGYMKPMDGPGFFDHGLSIVRSWTNDLRELEALLPRLANVPTLLIWGGADRAVYASSAQPLSAFFRNSQQVIFPGIGHLPYEECPDEFNRAVISFLASGVVPGN
jgi:pimeloyl-ACP methyl ester carboxylesterase